MKPLSIDIQAFGSYGKKTTIDFSKPRQNLFLITGDTGAGKTTIFDAIVFALYGEASSETNKKDGKELQSEFVSYDVEPFVTLKFTNGDGGDIFTVTRKPRHYRINKRKAGGVVEEKETVSLTLPDGTEYTQKEADDRIIEIVGLTKDQFMQTVMIAQGEFMTMLRDNSDAKKEVFRKLFNTEPYQRIVQELDSRRKSGESEMKAIGAACRMYMNQAVLGPEEAELLAMRTDISKAKEFSISDTEAFADGIAALTEKQKSLSKEAEEKKKAASRKRDTARDAYTNAENLQQHFQKKAAAEQDLKDCAAGEAAMKEAAVLIRNIEKSYEAKVLCDAAAEAEENYRATQEALQQKEKELPGLVDASEAAAKAEKEAGTVRDEAANEYSVCKDRVDQALQVLKAIAEAEKEAKADSAAEEKAKADRIAADKALSDFDAQAASWRSLEESLKGADVTWSECVRKRKDADDISAQLADLEQGLAGQKKKKTVIDRMRLAQSEAEEAFRKKHAEYVQKQDLFFDSQAGILASEFLKEGEPCPVCGSTSHPHPAVKAEGAENLTADIINALREASDALQKEANAQTEACSREIAAYSERKKTLEESQKNLLGAFSSKSGKTPAGVDDLKEELSVWQQALEREEADALKKKTDLDEARKNLAGADAKRKALSDAKDLAVSTEKKAAETLAQSRTTLANLKENKAFETAEDAKAALAEKTSVLNSAEAAYEARRNEKASAEGAKINAETLIAQYRKDLPGLSEKNTQAKEAYEEKLRVDNLSEDEWKDIVEHHVKEEKDTLQKQIVAYEAKKAAAERSLKEAEEGIAGREEPNVDALREQAGKAGEELQEAEQAYTAIQKAHDANASALKGLQDQLKERTDAAKKQDVIARLYRLLSGKETGSRMDIETYVQRYYLERILDAANSRFFDMSAGQYQLAMVDEDKAGEGKNRGLDLMVYSTVTGKVREVRTLSGGESFMAALSLALGMADQIGATSSAIDLDIMFIDEGFGSLDDHSREEAVKVLKNMAGTKKLIGIISHVTELKQEIDDQLIVTKGDDGSHVRWQLS